MTEIKKIKKRDKSEVEFEEAKIKAVIEAVFKAVGKLTGDKRKRDSDC